MATKKLMIEKVLCDCVLEDLDNMKLSMFGDWYEAVKKDNPGHTNFEFQTECFGYDGGVNLQLVGFREETEKELFTRMKRIVKAAEKKKAEKLKKEVVDRKQYETLKKKFEGK